MTFKESNALSWRLWGEGELIQDITFPRDHLTIHRQWKSKRRKYALPKGKKIEVK